jgi:hypothetical protein
MGNRQLTLILQRSYCLADSAILTLALGSPQFAGPKIEISKVPK